MSESQHPIEEDFALLRSAVSEAADLVRLRVKGSFRKWQKSDGTGLVTEIDMEVDRLLRDLLTSTRPDYGWLSEESEDDPSRLQRSRVWVVDPIDGTSLLASGQKEFAIAACLVENGVPAAGVVCQPIMDSVFEAVRGQGAQCDGKDICGPRQNNSDSLRLAGRKSVLRQKFWKDDVPDLKMVSKSLPMAMRACYVAAGRADISISHWPPWEWDIAAGDLIAREAGLRTSDTRGRELVYNTPSGRLAGLVMGTPEVHRRLLEQLVPATG